MTSDLFFEVDTLTVSESGMEQTAEDSDKMTSQQALCVADQKINKRPGISTLKVLKLSVINVYLLLTCDSVFLHGLTFILSMHSMWSEVEKNIGLMPKRQSSIVIFLQVWGSDSGQAGKAACFGVLIPSKHMQVRLIGNFKFLIYLFAVYL